VWYVGFHAKYLNHYERVTHIYTHTYTLLDRAWQCGSNRSVVNDALVKPGLLSAWGSVDDGRMISYSFAGELIK
jgi:hypothetical protein